MMCRSQQCRVYKSQSKTPSSFVRCQTRPITVTGQLADATGEFACLVFVLLAASVRPRVDQSASWQSTVVQLPPNSVCSLSVACPGVLCCFVLNSTEYYVTLVLVSASRSQVCIICMIIIHLGRFVDKLLLSDGLLDVFMAALCNRAGHYIFAL